MSTLHTQSHTHTHSHTHACSPLRYVEAKKNAKKPTTYEDSEDEGAGPSNPFHGHSTRSSHSGEE